MTYEVILKRALEKVGTSIDKRQGSVIYDALAPACAELAQIYISLDAILNESFADTASRDFLIRRAEERGLYPKSSSPAVMKGEFNIDVPIGSRFYLNNLVYTAVEKVEDCIFKMRCETNGTEGHRYFGTLLPFDNIKGLEKAEITDVYFFGEDEESTESLRKRYFDSFTSLAFGGNKRDYIEKTNLIPGVGGCKVIPAAFGGGTVKLIIISSDFSVPSEEFIQYVQEETDPFNYHGQGIGFAPIGHKVTVCGVKEKLLNIYVTLEYEDGFDFNNVKYKIYEKVEQYIKELCKKWSELDFIEIIAMKIGSDIFSVNGIKGISSVKLADGGNFENLILDDNEIPKISSIYINNET